MEDLQDNEGMTESISITQMKKVGAWFYGGMRNISTSFGSTSTEQNSSYETRSLPSRFSFNVSIPSFSWLENVCANAMDNRHFKKNRNTSTESDYSRYFDMADDQDFNKKSEQVPETQHYSKCSGQELETELFESEDLDSHLRRYDIQTEKMTMSDSFRRAKDIIRKSFVRLRPSLDNNGFNTRKADGVPEFTSSENIVDTRVDKKKMHTPQHEADQLGKLKLSLQHFPNTSQIRLLLFQGEDIKHSRRKIVVRATLLGSGDPQTCVSRKAELFARKALFNDNFYFKTEGDELTEYTIKLQLMKTKRFFRRPKTIGEVLINLGDLPLILDTNIIVPLYRKQDAGKILEAEDLKVSQLNRSIQEEVMAKLEITDTMLLRSKMKRVRSLPIIRSHRVVLETSPDRKHTSMKS